MKRFFNIFTIALASVLMFSCQEDAGLDYIENGGTVKGNFTIVVPANTVIDVTRGEAEESNVNDVYLFFFDVDNDYNSSYEKLTLSNPVVGDYTRTYNIKTTKSFVAGHSYEIYAIANPNSSLGDIESVESIDYATFRELLISLNTLNTSFNTLSMSGMITSRASDIGLTGKISVRRPFAKVEFVIKNDDASKFEFTPTSYSVKNVPVSSRLFSTDDGVEQMKRTADNYTDYNKLSDFIVEAGVNKIQLFQLENAAGISDQVANYNDRELRTDATTAGGAHETFAHGCEFATYIEIEGVGTGYNANGEPATQASLKYTIHLGDFGNNVKDFNVLRNHWYTYTVTVKGINNIKVEAESDEWNDGFQHGAEGTVIDMQSSKMIYNLDAHYEQARLKLDVTDLIGIDENGNEIVGITLAVSTPMMSNGDKNAVVDWKNIQAAAADPTEFDQKYDTKWVEFYYSTSFAKYPGAANTMTPVVFLNEIYKALKGQTSKVTITEENDGRKYVWAMAYINEYFYDSHPLGGGEVAWSEFVNQDDRTMKILQAPSVSADKHSIYTGALCAFTQHSIRTIFDYDAVGESNAYGIEWYDETGAMANFGSRSMTTTNTEKDNGYANFGKWVTSSWTTYLNNSGYDYTGQATGDARNEYNALKTQYAAYACLQRNRDLNNDNAIDATERRWYPAAINQYLAFWYGINALPNEAKFIKGDPANYATTPTEYGKLDHYFTSTYGGETYTSVAANNVYWAIEGFATSPDNTAYGHSGNHHIRCVRNLNSITEAPMHVVSSDALEGLENDVVIPNGLTASAYRGIATERLPIHHERDAANNLPKAFMVATADLESAYEAYSETFAAPEIFTVSANNDMVYFVSNDTYTYSTNANGASSSTVLKLNAQNGAAIALNTANTYFFWTKRIYNTYSGATTLKYENGAWVATTGTNGTLTVSGSNTNSTNTSFTAIAATQQDLCANYSEDTDYVGQPAWRVPNQKELAAMRSLELIDGPTSSGMAYHSSTMYSLRNLVSSSGTNERFSFQWYYGNQSESFGLQGMSNYPGPIRCVRDLTDEEFESLNSGNNTEEEL